MVLSRRNLCIVFLLLSIPALAKGGFELLRVLGLEAQSPLDSDALIFFTMGRGMLNGFVPYIDIWETKPPGIYLLMAASLLLSNGEKFAVLLQIFLFLLLPISLTFLAWKECKTTVEKYWKYAVVALTLLFGILLALYTEERSGTLFPEAFGAVFGSLYVLHAFMKREHYVKKDIAVSAVLLLLSIGMKEPFVFSLFAGALLIARSPRHFVRIFVLPLACAVVLGVIFLTLLGLLKPYLGIYLPVMLGSRIAINPIETVFVRAWNPLRLYADMTHFYTAPFFGYTMVALFIMFPLIKASNTGKKSMALVVLGTYLFLELFKLMFLWTIGLNTLRKKGLSISINDMPVAEIGTRVLLIFAVFLVILWFQRKERLAHHTLTLLFAYYLTMVSVGAGGYYFDNHFAFAIPAYVALAVLFIRHICSHKADSLLFSVIAILVLVGTFTYRANEEHLNKLVAYRSVNAASTREQVHKFDAILDSCGEKQYLSIDAIPMLAFSKHTPIGPMIRLDSHDYLDLEDPLYATTYDNVREHVSIIAMRERDDPVFLPPPMLEIFKNDFGFELPPCAQNLPPPKGFRMLYRKNIKE